MKMCVFHLSNETQTLLLGSTLAKICVLHCVIYLNGCIGTGKSVFCRGFLRALGYEGYVKSPTYTLIESYFLSNRYIYHIDCYRLHVESELICMDLREKVQDRSIFLIEWPLIHSKNLNLLPKPDIIVTINYGDYLKSRKVIVEYVTEFGKSAVKSLSCAKKFEYAIEI